MSEQHDSGQRRSAHGGFVGAFVRTVRSGPQRSPVGQVAASALIIVVLAGIVVGAGILLRPKTPAEKPVAATASAPSKVNPSSSRTPVRAPQAQSGAQGAPGPQGAPGAPGADAPVANQVAAAPAAAAAHPASTAGTTAAAKPAPAPATTATTGATAAAAARAATQGAVKKVTYSGVAGRGCSSAGSVYTEHGWYTSGNAGWWTLANGSYTGNGCNGQFTDMPMSGSASSDDSDQAIVWGFSVGSAAQSCTLSLYVPTSASARDVAATAAHFAVVHGNTIYNTTYVNPSGDHYVNQRDHHSSWVGLGTYPVHNGMIGVKLTNRGNPSGYPVTYPHLAGGAVRVSCVAE
ncbi:hypothetical protein [Paractinoplanes deccanensis]|nr:hypothetical protein [Actinoplanes deccanensis]